MATREEIREGTRAIISGDLIAYGSTHENPPPHKDCNEDCEVSLNDQIAAANPIFSPVRSGGKKHKKCMDCWNEYIDGLVLRIEIKQSSQGVAIKVDRELPTNIIGFIDDRYGKYEFASELKEAGYEAVEPLIKENDGDG